MTVLDILAIVISLLGGIGALVWLGWCLAVDYLQVQRVCLQRQRELLDAEWRTLDNTRRLRAAFLHARRSMQHVADDVERSGS